MKMVYERLILYNLAENMYITYLRSYSLRIITLCEIYILSVAIVLNISPCDFHNKQKHMILRNQLYQQCILCDIPTFTSFPSNPNSPTLSLRSIYTPTRSFSHFNLYHIRIPYPFMDFFPY